MRRGEQGGIFFRLLFLIVFFGFLALLYAFRHPVMRLAGEMWLLNDAPVQSDAIIILSDDNYAGDRATQAAELYRMGLAPLIVASGRALRPYAGISELMERDLESRGVPATAIVKFPQRAENTREEAEALSGLIASRGWKRVLVVTSNYHARRARFIFQRVLPPGISVQVIGAHDLDFDPARWWETRLGRKLFFDEMVGYVVARWELRRKATSGAGAIVSNFDIDFSTVSGLSPDPASSRN